jgi:hypothetical protein
MDAIASIARRRFQSSRPISPSWLVSRETEARSRFSAACERIAGSTGSGGILQVFILRDPRRQFTSALNQAIKGNRYFLERGWVILGANRDDPVFAPLRRIIDIPAYDGPLEERDAFYARQAWNTDWSLLYTIFYYLHLLMRRNLRPQTYDLLIDIDRLSQDPDAAAATETRIAELTGARISLADCKVENYDPALGKSAPFFAELEAQTAALLR